MYQIRSSLAERHFTIKHKKVSKSLLTKNQVILLNIINILMRENQSLIIRFILIPRMSVIYTLIKNLYTFNMNKINVSK